MLINHLDALSLVDVDIINGDVTAIWCSFKHEFVLAIAIDIESIVHMVPLSASLMSVILRIEGKSEFEF